MEGNEVAAMDMVEGGEVVTAIAEPVQQQQQEPTVEERMEELRRRFPVATLIDDSDSVTSAMLSTINEYTKRFASLQEFVFSTGKAIEEKLRGTPEIAEHAGATQILFRDVQLSMEQMRRHQRAVDELTTCIALKYIQHGGTFPTGDPAIGIAIDNPAVSGIADHTLTDLVIDTPIKEEML